jgi:hypothetical protein
MSDRKYRQRGYQDEPRGPQPPRDRPASGPREKPIGPRSPQMPGFREVRRCTRCGEPVGGEIAADTQCSRCGTDLHACIQCAAFDSGSRFECLKPVPARVAPKDARNTCELFEPRVTVERETGSTGPTGARKAFDDLFR